MSGYPRVHVLLETRIGVRIDRGGASGGIVGPETDAVDHVILVLLLHVCLAKPVGSVDLRKHVKLPDVVVQFITTCDPCIHLRLHSFVRRNAERADSSVVQAAEDSVEWCTGRICDALSVGFGARCRVRYDVDASTHVFIALKRIETAQIGARESSDKRAFDGIDRGR